MKKLILALALVTVNAFALDVPGRPAVKIINDPTVPAGKQYKVGDKCSPAKGTYQCGPVVNGTQYCGCAEGNS